jgi:trehalose/maltose transport system substrate-binding protein
MNVFDSGSAAFNRVWLGASTVRSGSSGQIYWRNLEPRVKTGFTSIPGGSGGSAGTLGGGGLAVSRHSAHPREAVKLIQFILRAQVELIQTQKDMATSRGQIKNFSLVPDDNVKLIQKGGMVYRPSIEAGSKYEQVSAAYVHALHMVLIGQKEAPQAAAELEKQLVQITGFHVGPPARK